MLQSICSYFHPCPQCSQSLELVCVKTGAILAQAGKAHTRKYQRNPVQCVLYLFVAPLAGRLVPHLLFGLAKVIARLGQCSHATFSKGCSLIRTANILDVWVKELEPSRLDNNLDGATSAAGLGDLVAKHVALTKGVVVDIYIVLQADYTGRSCWSWRCHLRTLGVKQEYPWWRHGCRASSRGSGERVLFGEKNEVPK